MTGLRPLRRPRHDDAAVLPLINVVFLLLVFFMVAGRLSSGEPFEIEPVISSSEEMPPPEAVHVLVAADGRIALDGAEIDRPALVGAAAARLRAGPGVEFRLKADGAAEAALVVAIMELLREAGVPSIRLMTVRGRPER